VVTRAGNRPAAFRRQQNRPPCCPPPPYLQENPPAAFSLWQKTHARSYKSPSEASRRQAIFVKNAEHVAAVNSRPDSTLRLALNQFADLTLEEFSATQLGFKPSLNTG
jgi:hypothetical protein